ncbi:MAG: FAD-binding oxidoreductase, partial [Pseudomonadota bacterium]
ILAASFCPTDGHADPHATVSAALGAAMHLGAKLRPGVGVESLKVAGNKVVEVVTNEGRLAAGAVIIAAGVETAALVRPLGAKLPLTIPIVTVVRTAPLPPCLNPVIGVANADLAVRQEVNGRLRLTSGAEPFQNSLEEVNGRPVARPSAVSLRQTLERVEAILPVLREAEIDAVWGGLLDLTPDALPVIDHIKGLENAVVAAGFSGHGFGIGPITGALAADLCLNRTPQMDISAFTFARFNSASTAEPAALTLHG